MLKNIVGYLEETPADLLDKTAYVDENRSITFEELRNEAKFIATSLLNDVSIGSPVLVYMDKSVESIVTFLGVAYTGAFYVPIDIHMPENRVKLIIDTLNASIVVSRRVDDLPEMITKCCKVIYYEDAVANGVTNEMGIAERQNKVIDADPMYAIFTSGSTGVPKGVLVSHRSVINFTEWWCETFEFDKNEVFANQTPFYFDASVKDIYATLRCKATMYIVPKKLFSLPKKLVQFLNDNKITCIDWVPSALCMIVNFRTFEKEKPRFLRKVMFLGEVMPTKQFNMWRRELPDVKYANLYGPTEATGDCTYYKIEREFADDEPIPIGFACNNTEVLLLDEMDELITSKDIIGEICVRGCSLALGYYNNLEKTNEVFVKNPLQSNYNERIYRTGDLGKYNEYNEIVYMSRKDFQIKHMGHRVELGEIETALAALEGIDRVCCLYDVNKQHIIAVYQGVLERTEIANMLKDKLPIYMLPNVYHKKEELPINLNGKIDRVVLKNEFVKE